MTGYPGRQPEPPPPPPFAKGGIIPPGSEWPALTACLYGSVITTVDLHEVGDGTVERVLKVVHADDTIGVATEALHQFDPRYFDADGNLALPGEYVYRPVRFAEQGRVVVCERVR